MIDLITIPDNKKRGMKHEKAFCRSYIIIRVSEKLSSHENRHQKGIRI